MAKGLKHGAGGGASLNFKVVGGTAAPASPKENTVWVNTSTAITGWAFCMEEPETPAEGMVWLFTGAAAAAPFNALKKNNITVYPISAKQYISGAWEERGAKSYQSGAWADWWNGHLYEYGNLHERVTGGWTKDGYKAKGYTTINPPQFNSNHIYVTGQNGYGPGAVGTVNQIDLNGRTKLCMLADVSYADTAQLSVVANKSDDLVHGPAATVKLPAGTAQRVTLDISAVTGGYIVVYASSPVSVYDIWLE